MSNFLRWSPALFLSPILGKNAIGQVLQNLQGGSFSLFNMQDFSAWTMQGNANWHIENNQVSANQGSGLLVSRVNLTNFILEMEYWADKVTQSALFLRCINPNVINSNTAYQIDLTNSPTNAVNSNPFLNIPDLLKKNTAGRWNTLKINAINNQFNVTLNNKAIVDNLINNQFSSGPIAIGLAEGALKLRSLRITIPGRW